MSPVGTRRKYLQDQNKRTFWVLGGYENWHGIPYEMMEKEEKRNAEGILVIGIKKLGKIDIYSGCLLPLIKSKRTLSHTQQGEYQFNIKIKGDTLSINEVPKLYLSLLGATTNHAGIKTSDKKMEDVLEILRGLSSEDRGQLIAKLKQLKEK